MGLQLTITLDNGITVESAYHKITALAGNKDSLAIYVNSYINRDSSLQGKPYLRQKRYDFIPSTDTNSVRWDNQSYGFLKTQPDFSGAIDIFEEI